MEPECKVKLEAFEGPLDLLLHLIYKNKIEITDIPIALVTSQYLEYLEFMQALDVVVVGEYLVMAATLMHIKSRMLLPRPDPPDPEDDPRLEIVLPLQELVKIREAAKFLEARPVLGRDVFIREAGPGSKSPESGPESDSQDVFTVGLTDLLSAFKRVLGGGSLPKALEIARAKVSLSERMDILAEELKQRKRIQFFELFLSEDREMVIVTFLALLELARLGSVRLIQEAPGRDILLLFRKTNSTFGVNFIQK